MNFLIDFLAAMVVALACYLILSCTVHAETSVQVLGPISLTQHIINDASTSAHFTNRVSKDGSLIDNPEIGIVVTHTYSHYYTTTGVFGGQDSVGSPMVGVIHEFGQIYGHWQLGGVAGAYLQDDVEFERRDIIPFEVGKFGNLGLVPVIGVAANYRINLNKNTYMQLNNIITPVLTNTVLSVGFKW